MKVDKKLLDKSVEVSMALEQKTYTISLSEQVIKQTMRELEEAEREWVVSVQASIDNGDMPDIYYVLKDALNES